MCNLQPMNIVGQRNWDYGCRSDLMRQRCLIQRCHEFIKFLNADDQQNHWRFCCAINSGQFVWEFRSNRKFSAFDWTWMELIEFVGPVHEHNSNTHCATTIYIIQSKEDDDSSRDKSQMAFNRARDIDGHSEQNSNIIVEITFDFGKLHFMFSTLYHSDVDCVFFLSFSLSLLSSFVLADRLSRLFANIMISKHDFLRFAVIEGGAVPICEYLFSVRWQKSNISGATKENKTRTHIQMHEMKASRYKREHTHTAHTHCLGFIVSFLHLTYTDSVSLRLCDVRLTFGFMSCRFAGIHSLCSLVLVSLWAVRVKSFSLLPYLDTRWC